MIIFVWLAVGWTLLSFFISPLLGALILFGRRHEAGAEHWGGPEA
jgi:hypothetical protein